MTAVMLALFLGVIAETMQPTEAATKFPAADTDLNIYGERLGKCDRSAVQDSRFATSTFTPTSYTYVFLLRTVPAAVPYKIVQIHEPTLQDVKPCKLHDVRSLRFDVSSTMLHTRHNHHSKG